MPTDVWVDEMDGPERHERAKKRRADQLKRWETREATSNDEPHSKRKHKRTLKFVPNIVMLEAAARDDLGEVASLLESGVSPDLANEDGLTALHQSCIDGCDDMVKYLIEHKANVNACDNERWTPLHAAAACGHLSIIQYLLKNGGDIMALNLDGNLPAGVVDDNEEVEKFLDKEMLKLGYDEAAIEELRLNQGKILLNDLKDSVKNGRSLDIQDEEGATAFHVAAANGWTNIIDFLLENEADFEVADNDGWQPIHAAAAWGHDTILEILVASGADLDSKTNDSSTPLDLTEETEIIELIEELKTKEVKYPRKGKGVRRKRSNTSNSSIKRTSIHEKSELSHSDSKAERAALLKQLSQEEPEVSSPVEPVSPPVSSPVEPVSPPVEPVSSPVVPVHTPVTSVNTPVTSHTPDGQSNSSRDENNSSGYVSEGSSDAKTEEKNELLRTSEIAVNIDNKKDEGKTENKENNLKVTTKENKASTNIKQSPVPKPPRLGTSNSISKHEPQAYINIEIEPAESKSKTTSSSTPKPEPNTKQDLPKTQNESLNPNTDTTARNATARKAELKTQENANKEHDTNPLERRTTSTLPKLASTDKRKAPEPPDVATHTKHASLSEKDSKKANRSRARSSESSSKKRCTIL